MPDVIVIGAGLGGLAAAIDLAARGRRVTVLEAHAEAGGKVGRAVTDGVEFDTGPSVLTMPEVFRALLRAAGADPDALELVRHDHVFDYLWPDGTRLAVHLEPEQTLASVASTLGPRARDELAAFLRYARGIWEEAAPPFVYGDAPGLRTAMKLGLRALTALRRIDPARSMQQGIEAHVREPHLRDLLMRYATYNGSDPRVAPATLNCIAHVELDGGCFGVRGGTYSLIHLLQNVATSLGVDFRFNEPVRRIDVANSRVVGVTTDHATLTASVVIANADVVHVFTDLLPTTDHPQTQPSTSGFTAVLRATPQPRAPHTVLFPHRYDDEFTDLFDHHRPPQNPAIYLCAQSIAHQRPTWPDHHPLFVMANAPAEPPHNPTPPAIFEALERHIRAQLLQHHLITPHDTTVWRRTPTQLATAFLGSRGAIYGAASNSRFAAFQRPPNRVDQPRGLFLASGSAHPGGGMPLCVLSGRAAARAVARAGVGKDGAPPQTPPRG